MSNKTKDNNKEEDDKGGIRKNFEDSRRNESYINKSKRLSQDEEKGRSLGGLRNVEATEFLRGYEEANPEKQQDRLIEWAKQNNCLYNLKEIEEEFGAEIFEKLKEELGTSSPSGGAEALVYRYDDNNLLKVVRYNVWDTRPLGFLDNRISLHNHLFSDTHYELIGICPRGMAGKFSFVVKQPFIKGTRPTQKEIQDEMTKYKKFTRDYSEETQYNSEDYIIRDLHTGNWIKGQNGKMYCIDPAPSLNSKRIYHNI